MTDRQADDGQVLMPSQTRHGCACAGQIGTSDVRRFGRRSALDRADRHRCRRQRFLDPDLGAPRHRNGALGRVLHRLARNRGLGLAEGERDPEPVTPETRTALARLGPPWPAWVRLGPTGSVWVRLGPSRSLSVPLGPSGSLWVRLGPGRRVRRHGTMSAPPPPPPPPRPGRGAGKATPRRCGASRSSPSCCRSCRAPSRPG